MLVTAKTPERRWRIYVFRVELQAVLPVMIAGEPDFAAKADEQPHWPGIGHHAVGFLAGIVRRVGEVEERPHHELHVIVVPFARDVWQLAGIIKIKKTAVIRFGGHPIAETDAFKGQRHIDRPRIDQRAKIVHLKIIRLPNRVIDHAHVRRHVGDGGHDRRVTVG